MKMSVLQEIKGLTKELYFSIYFPGGSPVSMQNLGPLIIYMLYLFGHKHGLHYHTVRQYCVYRDGYGGLASCPYIREFQFSLSFSRTYF